ncbi:MAG: GNAT family N-acetyltransferase [Betaproteobacteria bacterium]
MFSLRAMTIDDYDLVIALMKQSPGVTFRDADSRESTARYLERNRGLSFVAMVDEQIIGCIMAGHDGRRGYLQHLVVHPMQRKQGIAKFLIENCLLQLEQLGIHKFHIDVLNENQAGIAFWESQGWKLRSDIKRYSLIRSGSTNT